MTQCHDDPFDQFLDFYLTMRTGFTSALEQCVKARDEFDKESKA